MAYSITASNNIQDIVVDLLDKSAMPPGTTILDYDIPTNDIVTGFPGSLFPSCSLTNLKTTT